MNTKSIPAVALFSLFISATAFAQSVARGPYIQQTAAESSIVVWRTDVATDGVVRWGTSAQNLDQTATSTQNGTQHEVRITGLSPRTRYYYSVGTAQGALGGGTAEHYFETAPTPGVATPTRLWVVGDSGTGGARQAAVRDAMLGFVGTKRPDMFIHVGDMAYSDGLDSEFQGRFFEMYPTILQNTVTWPALGNHEGHSADSQTQSGPYYDAYVLPTDGSSGGLASGTEAYYSYDWGSIHFIVLDSHDSPREATGTMATWLTADLASTNADWIIAFWHHPPYTKGSHDSDTEGRLIDMREEILPILEAGGVDLVLGGHSHIYERSYLLSGAYDTPTVAQGYILDSGSGRSVDGPYLKPAGASEGAIYIVAGHGGAGVSGEADHPVMYFSERDHGSCIVDIDGSLLTVQNVRHDGVISDDVALARGDGVFVLRPASEEILQAGATFPVRWLATNTRAVKVEFSPDDGATWTTLAAEVAAVNTLDWVVPETPTVLGRIRITDADDATRTAINARPFVITDEAPRVVIPYGSIWSYDDAGGEYPDDIWAMVDFDDGGWKSGPGQLGYGDGDEATELLDADPNIPSVLFRHTVTLQRPVASAQLEAIYDDAIGVWVNGELVHKENLLQVIDLDRYSGTSSGDNAITAKDFGADNPFVVGENVIAAMVKQTNETSSDLSFDLQLTITYEPNVPMLPGDMGGDAGSSPGPDGGAGTVGSGDGGTDPGSLADAASPVAKLDGGTNDGTAINGKGGCGCSSSPAPAEGAVELLMFMLGFATLRRTRR